MPATCTPSAAPYTVTLTVTDNRGASATTTSVIDVVVPNVPPVASFAPSLHRTGCSFDGTGSSDADGTIGSYDWNFGDGTTGAGAAPTHTYSAAGTYTVALTVTDNSGGTNTKTTGVAVVDPNATPTVTFRAATSTNVNSYSTATVTVPATVKAGDLMVLIASSASNTTTMTGPAGSPF